MAKKQLEDIFFLECTVGYDAFRKIAEPLKQTHHVVWLTVDPLTEGVPHRRPRVFLVGINLATYRWLGGDVQDEYGGKFMRSRQLTGMVFFNATGQERITEYKQLAEMLANFPNGDVLLELPPDVLVRAVFSPEALTR